MRLRRLSRTVDFSVSETYDGVVNLNLLTGYAKRGENEWPLHL